MARTVLGKIIRRMITSPITRDAFVILRTPRGLARYVSETYDYIAANDKLKADARLRKEPYKSFIEELMPFSHFCTWKYGDRNDVLCALVSGTLGGDATIIDKNTRSKHSVEITWPIDGRKIVQEGRQLNERGSTDFNVWDYNNTSQYQAAIDRTLTIAKKKAVRDYRNPGGSSIIFVFDHSLFWDSNPKHVEVLQSLRDRLSEVSLLVDNVLLMLIFGNQKRIIVVKGNEQGHREGRS